MAKQKNVIKCAYHSPDYRQWYVSEEMKVYPCCFYVEQTLLNKIHISDPKFAKLCKDDPDWNSLEKHSMEEIINHPMYQHDIWYPGWESDPSSICVKHCGPKTKRRSGTRIKFSKKST